MNMSHQLYRRVRAILTCTVFLGVLSGCLDQDRDRVLDALDNCPTVANANQSDDDDDGVGDACEFEDRDRGECADGIDNDADGKTDGFDSDCD